MERSGQEQPEPADRSQILKPAAGTRRKRPRTRRPWFRRMLVLAVLGGLWAGWPVLCRRQASSALKLQQPETAVRGLRWADLSGLSTLETALLRCQTARRIGDSQAIRSSLQALETLGASPRRIEREQILALAHSGRMREAAPHMSRLLTDLDGDNRDVSCSYIVGFLRAQRYREAGALIDALMKDDPENPFPWYARGRVFALQQLLPKAEADFREALKLSPDWSEPAIELAELLHESHRQRDAMPLFRKLLDQQQFTVRAAVGLADCLKSIGEPQQATAVLEQARDNGQADAAWWIALGRLHFEEGRFDEAEPALQRGLLLQPWADDARFTLAQCQRQLQKDDIAADNFRRVEDFRAALAKLRNLQDQITASPTNEQVRMEAAELMLKYQDPQDGVVALQGVLDLNPHNKQAHKLLADYFDQVRPATDQSRQQAGWHRQQAE
ncbi:MAG: tetratricopeptide repeat protein [Planctomyces sp.]